MITLDTKYNFQVYLEGVPVPFSTVVISESERNFPTAQITFPATEAALRLLPGTMVQVFGPIKNKYNESYTGLIFEGEISGVSYQKAANGQMASILCNSVFARFYQCTLHPADSLMTDGLKRRLDSQYGLINDPSAPSATKSDAKIRIKGMLVNDSNVHAAVLNSARSSVKAKQAEDKKSIGLTSGIDNMILLSANNMWLNFVTLMNTGVVGKGDYLPMIQYFLRYYERGDPYFGVQSLSYSLAKSVFSFPNHGKATAFLNQLCLDKMRTSISLSTNTSVTLWQALSEFMRITAYTFMCPAAPTEVSPFWGASKDQDFIIPNRLFFSPGLENAPPAKFNIIFPNQISSFTYQRDMSNEATRYVGELGLPFKTNGMMESMKGINICYVVPQLSVQIDPTYKLTAGMTTEESYRGIKADYSKLDFMKASASNSSTTGEAPELTGDIVTLEGTFGGGLAGKATTSSGFGTAFKHMVAKNYLDQKYEKRLLSVQCEWSPFRMTGVAGAIIDDSGPAIVGVVSSINTTIDASGQASSIVSFRAPRLIFDDDFSEAFQGNGTNPGLENYLVNDFSNDGILDISKFLYDETLYNFEHIGYNLYTFLATGRESIVTHPFSDLSKSIYARFASSLNSSKKTAGDFSILSYIRKNAGSLEIVMPENLISEEDTKEIRASKYLFQAIRKAKEKYIIAKNEGSFALSDFVAQETWRAIISKENYFNSIGIETEPTFPVDYKDGTKIFGTVVNVRGLKAYLDNNRDIQKFTKTPIEDISLVDVQPYAKVTNSVVDRVSALEETIRALGVETDPTKQEAIRLKAREILKLRRQIRLLDTWLSTVNKRNWVTLKSDLDEESIFNLEDASDSDFLQLLTTHYGENTEDAIKKLSKLNKALALAEDNKKFFEKNNTMLSPEKEGLESDTFKPYNITRYAHVRKAFSSYKASGELVIIK